MKMKMDDGKQESNEHLSVNDGTDDPFGRCLAPRRKELLFAHDHHHHHHAKKRNGNYSYRSRRCRDHDIPHHKHHRHDHACSLHEREPPTLVGTAPVIDGASPYSCWDGTAAAVGDAVAAAVVVWTSLLEIVEVEMI